VSQTPHLDDKHVVFGEVIKGKSIGMSVPLWLFDDRLSFVVRAIENYPTASGDVPTSPIIISACGVLSPDDPSLAPSEETIGDSYEDYPEDDDSDVQNPEVALDIARKIRELGNKLFKEGQIELALKKYLSELSARP